MIKSSGDVFSTFNATTDLEISVLKSKRFILKKIFFRETEKMTGSPVGLLRTILLSSIIGMVQPNKSGKKNLR